MSRPVAIAGGITAGLLLVGAVGFFVVAPPYFDAKLNQVVTPPPYPVSEDAKRLHGTLFVVDLHSDLLLWERDPLERGRRGHTDVPRLREGNVALQVFSVVTKVPATRSYERNEDDSDLIFPLVAAQLRPPGTWFSAKARAVDQARRLSIATADAGGKFVLIRSRYELERFLEARARESDIVAGLLAIEGLHAMEGELYNLDALFDAGFRMMGLAHFFDNEVAGSAHGVEKGGLTSLGRQVVRRMEQLGVIVDLAHASPQAVDEVLEMVTKPVVVSHTGVQGTCPGPRNLSDEQIRKVAATGGVIGIGFWPGAVCDITPEAIARAIRYTADLAGVEHVAFGSDFDGTIEAYFDATGLPLLTEALLAAGFTEPEVRKIAGENVLRLLRKTLP